MQPTPHPMSYAVMLPLVFTLFLGYLLVLEFISEKDCFLPGILIENTAVCPDYGSWANDMRLYLVVAPLMGILMFIPYDSLVLKMFKYMGADFSLYSSSGDTFWWIAGYICSVLFLSLFGLFLDRKGKTVS